VSVSAEFHPLAADEIADAEDWYERRRSGLGARFLEVVEATVNRASRSPRTGTPVVVHQQGSVRVRKMSLGVDTSRYKSQHQTDGV